jgi:hypothetical protein
MCVRSRAELLLHCHMLGTSKLVPVAILLYFYFNVHTRRKVQSHEHIDGLGVWIQNIDQAVMCADFKMLV